MDSYISNLIKSIQLSGHLARVELVETHISWILLTGKYAYKIKKPLALGFLDFSSLQKRAFYCQEELRLNSRLAPDIYLSVVPITGTLKSPQLNGTGETIDYAVKMKQFPANAELSHLVENNQLYNEHIDSLAEIIAIFHQKIDKTSSQSLLGTAELTHQTTLDTFNTLLENLTDKKVIQRVKLIQSWCDQTFSQMQSIFQQRHDEGYIRECHGDLHLRNIALIKEKILLFDGVEFSESLRWIDVISEIAFLMMDLQHQDHQSMAFRLLNAYLEHSGDYQSLQLLPYYLVYRTIVRTMVATLRASQADVDADERLRLKDEILTYLSLAETYISPKEPILLICHGLSASGKSTISQSILENLPAIRLRSDVERKRLFGFAKYQPTESALGENIYHQSATDKTYQRLKELAYSTLQSGFNVIVDATFLSRFQRQEFYLLANSAQVKFIILDFLATENVLHERIKKRTKNNRSASEADINILLNQIENQELLSAEELDFTLQIDTESAFQFPHFLQQLISGNS